MRPWSFALVCALLAGCGADPPNITLVVDSASPPIRELARLELIVRVCDNDMLGARKDLLGGSIPSTIDVQAAVTPGSTFYVWLQGWQTCTPPCVPEDRAVPGDCTCIAGGANQVLVSEGCTMWIASQEQSAHLPLAPLANPRLCPPRPLADCSKLQ